MLIRKKSSVIGIYVLWKMLEFNDNNSFEGADQPKKSARYAIIVISIS